MDNITHSLIGALIGQTGLKKLSGLGMPTLIIAANIPDIDAACFLWLEGTEHLGFRRGITHGPLAMLVLPLLLTAAMVGFDRWQTRRGKRPATRAPVRFGPLYLLALIGTLSHPAFDWLNNYGVRLLEPFSSRWFYGDTLFIIDVWLWAILIGGWFWSRRAEKRGGDWMRRGQVVATVAGLYVFANGLITGVAEQRALAELASLEPEGYRLTDWRDGVHGQFWILVQDRDPENPQRLVVASPPPLAFWRRDIFWRDGDVFGSGEYSLADGLVLRDGSLAHRGADIRLLAISPHNSQVAAFLSWSRMPVIRFNNGRILIRDQRFDHIQTRGRFSVDEPIE